MSVSWSKSGQLVYGGYAMGTFYVMLCDKAGNVYVGGDTTGPFRSTNQGSSWTHITGVTTQLESGCVGSNGYIYFGSVSTTIYRSIDNGVTWTTVTPLPDSTVKCMCGDTIGNIYAQGWTAGTYKSSDNGATWTNIGPSGLLGTNAQAMFVDYSDNIYICCMDSSAANPHSYVSKDHGATWTVLSTTVWRTACADRGGNLYSGGSGYIQKSTDGGLTWTTVYNTDTTTVFYTCFQDTMGNIWFGSQAGTAVVYSSDFGATWNATLSTTQLNIQAGCADRAGYVHFGASYLSASPTTTGYLYTNSAVLPSVVATPTASVATGSYSATQSVTLSCATSGAVIYYTTDGTTPTTASSNYSTALSISATTTLKAIAVAQGITSATASYTYTYTTKQLYTYNGSVWKPVTSIYVGVNGAWKLATPYGGLNGTWK